MCSGLRPCWLDRALITETLCVHLLIELHAAGRMLRQVYAGVLLLLSLLPLLPPLLLLLRCSFFCRCGIVAAALYSTALTDTSPPLPMFCCPPDALMLVLRNLEYVGYATSGGKVVHDIEAAEQKFNSVLTEVRGLALVR